MRIEEYIEKAKSELDELKKDFIEGNKVEPDMWPLDLDEAEWGDQELSKRFGQI